MHVTTIARQLLQCKRPTAATYVNNPLPYIYIASIMLNRFASYIATRKIQNVN